MTLQWFSMYTSEKERKNITKPLKGLNMFLSKFFAGYYFYKALWTGLLDALIVSNSSSPGLYCLDDMQKR